MPIVVVTAERLPDEATEIRATASLASSIADSLDLPHHEVYVTLTGANVAVVGAEPVRPWPVVVIYGRESGNRPAAVAAVRAGLGHAVEHSCPGKGLGAVGRAGPAAVRPGRVRRIGRSR